MPGFVLRRDENGRLRLRAFGCCDPVSTRRMYDRAFVVQELRRGGRLTDWDSTEVEVTDRKGRVHRLSAV
ncbi:MAG: hypothetical protein ACTHNU_03035 [Gaiellales bacterium]|jgi:hypothetical protein